ncbi:MAG: hypothetical protein FJX76_22910 [Armatimonadetes bacterium]|nr:hypothetical protein [Armatimonadota bacterium]
MTALRVLSAQRRPRYVMGWIALDWAAILLVVFAWGCLRGTAAEVPLAVLGMAVVGIQQHALALWLHEGSHWLFFTDRRVNDAFTSVVLAAPLCVSLPGYRSRHFAHHQHLGTGQDTKRVAFTVIRGWQFPRFCVEVLLGGGFLRRAGEFYGTYEETGEKAYWWLPVAVAQGLLFGLFSLLAKPEAYLLFWMLPLVTIKQLVAGLRAILEHQPLRGDPRGYVRPLEPTWWEHVVFFRAGFDYHWEHHQHPGIPCFNLKFVRDEAVHPRTSPTATETLWNIVRG